MKFGVKPLPLAAAALVVAAILVITGFFTIQLRHFSLDATTDSLVLQSDPDLAYYRATRETFGSDEYVIVAFGSVDVLSPQNVELVEAITAQLAALPGIGSVTSLTTAPLFRSPLSPNLLAIAETLKNPVTLAASQCDRELARKELCSHSVFSRNIISPDCRTTALLAYFRVDPELTAVEKKLEEALEEGAPTDLLKREVRNASLSWKKRRRETVGAVRNILRQHETPDRRFYLSGVPVVVHDMVGYIKGDMRLFGIGVTAFLMIGLLVAFRRLRWMLLPVATCLVVVIWVVGMMAFAQKPTTVVTSNLSSLLFIVAMAHSIHLIVGYQEATEVPGHSGRIAAAMRRLITPCFYTAATTAVGFASLVICDIQPVKDFGIYMSIGVALALVISFTFFPAVLLLSGGRGLQEPRLRVTPRFLRQLASFALNRRLLLAVLAILLVVVSVFGIMRISTETRFIDYFREDSEIYTGLEFIDNNMGGTTSLEVILSAPEPGYFRDAGGISRIRPLQEFLEKRPEIGKVISLVNFKDEFGKLIEAGIKKLGPLGTMVDQNTLLPVILEQVPRDVVKSYVNEDFSQARIFIRVRETAPGLVRNSLISDIRAFIDSSEELRDLSPRLSGIFLLYSNMLDSLTTSQLWAFWVVFAAIFVMFLALFRSPQLAAYAMIPNVLPVLTVLGIMGFTGVHLDMMTIMIASVSLGIGADGAIHYIFRYKKEFAACADPVEAMHRSHASIGRAILLTSLTVVAGFWILVFSNFAPTVYFGLFTGLSMLAALAGSLVLLPLCLVTFKPIRPPTRQDAPSR